MYPTTKLGAAIQARASPSEKWAPATLIEVKRLAADSSQLVAYVQWKEREGQQRRKNLWVSISDVVAEESISEPLVSGAALQHVPRGDLSYADFFEDRLRRDMGCPTSIYEFHYLDFSFRSWFYAPFHLLYPGFDVMRPELPDAYLCPFSLQAFTTQEQLEQHVLDNCTRLAPPGDLIYSDDAAGVSVYEVDGAKHRNFSRNLFLVGKSFLENKLAGYDVHMYLFYVVCLQEHAVGSKFVDQPDARYIAGFYSWEKGADDQNLACIVTLPCFQGRGIGNFLVSLSYQLSYRRGCIGSPERPLSDLGQLAYEKYWMAQVWKWADEHIANEKAVEVRSDEDNEDMEDEEAEGAAERKRSMVTLKQIAKDTKLEEADVIDIVLKMGLLHRTESKAVKLMLPTPLIRKDRQMRIAPKSSTITFNIGKLVKAK